MFKFKPEEKEKLGRICYRSKRKLTTVLEATVEEEKKRKKRLIIDDVKREGCK